MEGATIWPEQGSFLDISSMEQASDGRARCTAIAICDAAGNPCLAFYQGQPVHFFYEVEVLGEIGVPSGGIVLLDAAGVVVHGKNSFQYGAALPHSVKPGQRLRFHQAFDLDLGPGTYTFTVGISSTDENSYRKYATAEIGYAEFAPLESGHCQLANVATFTVGFDRQGKLSHHGVANLGGEMQLTVLPAQPGSSIQPYRTASTEDAYPTIVHVTHWKAGSQWIHKILLECAPERVVEPKLNQSQFLMSPVRAGKIYPTVYVTKQQFDSRKLPSDTRRFVVIRDLRDTLVSAYFSMKISHPVIGGELSHLRPRLQQLNQEEGLLYMLDNWLPPNAQIQISWLEAGEPLIRYQDLLDNDLGILEAVLLDRCRLPIDRERFRQVVINNRFENVTAGRTRGSEDIQAHERKGVSGDWKNYFTDHMKEVFKIRYGGLLVAAGFERDLNW